MSPLPDFRDCKISVDRVYRYRLRIRWDRSRPAWGVVGLNPSTADEANDDHTVRKWLGFARRGGAGALWIVNLFAVRSTSPLAMKRHPAPCGNNNDYWIIDAANNVDRLILCWGIHGTHLGRGEEVSTLLADHPTPRFCWGYTANGQPKHPLMLQYESVLQECR